MSLERIEELIHRVLQLLLRLSRKEDTVNTNESSVNCQQTGIIWAQNWIEESHYALPST